MEEGPTERKLSAVGAKDLDTLPRSASLLNQQKMMMVLMRLLHKPHLKGASLKSYVLGDCTWYSYVLMDLSMAG